MEKKAGDGTRLETAVVANKFANAPIDSRPGKAA
jgi:hypothetical protein